MPNRSPESSYKGFIRGMLEAINIHNNANAFRLYPTVGPSKVTCHFPEDKIDQAVKGVGHYVEARGTMFYRPGAKFPHAVEVDELEVFPPSDQLPTLDDLLGMAPNATGELSSEDFIRKIRNAKG